MRRILFSLIISASPALAEEPSPAASIIDGVYMTQEDLCARAKAEGVEAVAEEGNLVLHAGKLESIEYHCDFVDVIKVNDIALVITAWCEEPDFAFPDLISVTKRNDTTIQLSSVRDQPELPSGNSGTWVKCEGVSMP
ncbi:MAG: hypothetical protein IPL47_06505 [Phyllobacteriaceae bacterium]|nr:hypothetical protein [Phyllobacteriaceae bacterium]